MKVLLLSIVVLLSACVTAPKAEQWPQDMPPLAYFKAYYDRDDAHKQVLAEKAYLTWVYRFYNGWELYSRGWLQATDELADSLVLSDEKARGRALMDEIGLLIAPDWAKSDPHRTIKIRHVALWGNVILKGMVMDEQFPVLYKIRDDAQQMLAGNLDPKIVKKDRYVIEEDFADLEDTDF